MKQEPQPAQDITRILPWLVIFRSFSLAFDTSKLLLAALGILTTATGWWVLSFIFTLGYDAKPHQYANEWNTISLSLAPAPPAAFWPTGFRRKGM